MAGNVVTHGFSKDNKKHSVDIRILHCEKCTHDVIMTIRDSCMEFNPSERARIDDGDAEGKNMGIQMIYKIADEVTYQNLLGLNVLTMKLKQQS